MLIQPTGKVIAGAGVVLRMLERSVKMQQIDVSHEPTIAVESAHDDNVAGENRGLCVRRARADAGVVTAVKNYRTELATTAAILAYVVYNCTYAGLSLPAGIRSDRIDRRWLLGAGFVVFAVVYAAFALTDRAWTVWPLFAIYGSYIAMTEGVGKAYVSDLVPDEHRATALGLYNALTGGAILFASVLGGALWDLVGPSATFAFGAGMALIAAALLVITATEQRSGRRFGSETTSAR